MGLAGFVSELLDVADRSHVPSCYTDLLSDPQIVPSAGPRPHPRLGLPSRSPASFQPVRAQDPSRAVETPGDQSTFPQGCCLAGGFLSRMLSTLYACVSHMACVCRPCMWHVNEDLGMCPAHGGARDAAEIPHVPFGPQFSLKPQTPV